MAETTNPNNIAQAGDVKFTDVSIITSKGFTQDITAQITNIEIYESIHAPFIVGKLTVLDSQSFSSLLPLIGEEQIYISIITPGFDDKHSITGRFTIYKMDDKVNVKERTTSYTLYFISREAVIDLNHKISKVFTGEIHTIVDSILKTDIGFKTDKPCNIEPTKNKTKYISNFWSPLKNIKYITEQALSDNDSASFVFFENKYGFNFISLDALYSEANPPINVFRWDNYTSEISSTGGSVRALTKDYERILEFQVQKPYDYIDRLKSGMYGSEIIYYDILTKQYVHKTYTPNWEKNENHLNPYPVWSSAVIARPKAVLIHDKQYYNNFDGFGSEPSNTKTIQKRAASLAMADAYKCEISVYGRTDYAAGQKIYLEVPKRKQISSEDNDYIDRIMSGYYIIGSILHDVNRQEHKCTMEIIKESYQVNLDDPI